MLVLRHMDWAYINGLFRRGIRESLIGQRKDAQNHQAGVAPSPLAKNAGLPTDASGWVIVNEFLAVDGADGAWALGDCAAVPDLAAGNGSLCAPPPSTPTGRPAGSRATLSPCCAAASRAPTGMPPPGRWPAWRLYRGVAEVYGLRMRGFPAWITHRTYHLLRLPTMNRRLRVVSDWTLALLFPREVVSLDVLEHPRQDFQAALRVIATGPPHRRHSRVRKRKKMTIMLTPGEQQELRQIEQELRDTDRGFGRRLTLLQGMLRWARPGRQTYLLALAVLAAALLRLAAAAGRPLIAVARGRCSWNRPP